MKTCKEWIRKQLKAELTGKEFEVKTKGRNKADWLFEDEENNAIIIEDKEATDTSYEKAIIQVNNYGEQVYEKYKNIITIAVKELTNGDHKVAVFVNGKRLDNHPLNSLNTLEWYWALLSKDFDRDLLSKNIAYLNNEMHAMGIADNIRASIAATLLVCINKHLELEESDDIDNIENKVYKHLYMYTKDENGEDLNKWKKIRTLYDRFKLDLQKEKSYLTAEALYKVWKIIKFDIHEYIKNVKTQGYDIMSLFFTTFSKAALSNDKGQYFTPDHISSLMIDLVDLNVNSKVLDPTCGSGTFLAKCMDRMIQMAGNNESKITEIKQQQIYGIEKDETVYGLATANMLLHKDGKSNVENGNCFDLLPAMKSKGINRVVMNPPYKEKTTDIEELKFLYETLEAMSPDGLAAIIIPTSCATGAKYPEYRYSLMQKHTLLAVMTCPPELFYPGASTNTCIMLWKAHVPHSGKTYLADWKEDGFRKKRLGKKNTVRICDDDEWNEKKNGWLEDFRLNEPKVGLKVELTDKVSWLYESHFKIDFKKSLQVSDFEKSVNDYLAFLISNEGEVE
ncbi:MAG: N-6 DNA methylase [Bacilli bacterium]|nr:N-6 DNA methylase [Bacilli bacterium]